MRTNMTAVKWVCLLAVALVATTVTLASATPTGGKLVQPVIDPSFAEHFSEVVTQVKQSQSSASTSTSSQSLNGCPAESLKRIGLCQKIVRTFLAPNPNPTAPQGVPFASAYNTAVLCTKLTFDFPSTVNALDCPAISNHIIAAAGTVANLIDLSRSYDIHDVCARVLSLSGTSGPLIAPTDLSTCSLGATGGLTGVRALFLHGMGMTKLTYPGLIRAYSGAKPYDGWLGSWPKYWNVENTLDGLADARFYVTDTTQRGWNDLTLQTEFCQAIARFNPHVIFTHSMGNNIIGGAVFNRIGACTRISKTGGGNNILWFSSQAPWTGSPAADAAVAACQVPTTASLWTKLKDSVIRASSPCGLAGVTSLQESFITSKMPNVKQVVSNYLSGAMCSIDSVPLTMREAISPDGIGLWFLSKLGKPLGLLNWGRDAQTNPVAPYAGNDGLVTWSACNLPSQTFVVDSTNPFYVGRFSHEDGTCFTNDVPTAPASKRPCNWFVQRIIQTRRSFALPTTKSPNVGPISHMSTPSLQSLAIHKALLEVDAPTTSTEQFIQHHSTEEHNSFVESDSASDSDSESDSEFDLESDLDSDVDNAHEFDSEFAADAEIGADVTMELQHQQDLDEASENETEELEAQIEHI